MPIYVYEPTIYSIDEQVNDCCYFENLQSISEMPLTHCPKCGHAVHRAVAQFNFKGNTIGKGNADNVTESSMSQTSSSTAKNAAQLAARHLCGAGCRH
jgi:putative FmdB family regulatory protein